MNTTLPNTPNTHSTHSRDSRKRENIHQKIVNTLYSYMNTTLLSTHSRDTVHIKEMVEKREINFHHTRIYSTHT